MDVARGDGGVVDDHAGGLDARAAGTGGHVVDRRRGRAGEHRDVVEQRGSPALVGGRVDEATSEAS